MSLVSDALKLEIKNQFSKLHDTFKRQSLKVYSDSEVLIASTNPDFNPIFQQPNYFGDSTPKIQDIDARILYGNEMSINNTGNSNEGNLRLNLSEGEVRIKIKESDAGIFKDAKRVELDGELFSIVSSKRPIGIFETGYYSFTLRKVD